MGPQGTVPDARPAVRQRESAGSIKCVHSVFAHAGNTMLTRGFGRVTLACKAQFLRSVPSAGSGTAPCIAVYFKLGLAASSQSGATVISTFAADGAFFCTLAMPVRHAASEVYSEVPIVPFVSRFQMKQISDVCFIHYEFTHRPRPLPFTQLGRANTPALVAFGIIVLV